MQIAFLAVLVLSPLAGFLFVGHPGTDIAFLIGRGSGILGLSCLLWAGIISARVPGTDIRWGGLTRIWKIHHTLGAISFILVMLHPLILAFANARGADVHAAADILFPLTGGKAIWLGWLAWATMLTFLAPTFLFFGRPEYERWKILHALAGPAMALALAHAWPLNSSHFLRGHWLIYSVAAISAFGYRMFIAPRRGRRPHTVTATRRERPGVIELTLTPDGPPLAYESGQFIYMTPLDPRLSNGRGQEHPYTISSAPFEPNLRLIIKDLGDATHALQSVAIGSKALIEGPYGALQPGRSPHSKEIWIAGGVGLAPFLSAARSLSRGASCDAALVYCVQDESRADFRAELEGLAARVPGLRLYMHYFAKEKALRADFLLACCPDAPERTAFVCGPPPLIAGARHELVELGVPPRRIYAEEFSWF